MKTRYRLIRRGLRGGGFYCVDTNTGKRTSLGTSNEEDARKIVEAKNQAERQPVLNLQIAKAYLAGTDSGITTRTWQHVFEALMAGKQGANQRRWQTAAKDRAFDLVRHQVVIETQGERLLKVIQQGTVSTNLYLRRLHNFALDMSWLPWPIIPKRQWPKIQFKSKRAITWEEHQKILAGERNPELRDYYELLWHLGGSQTDMAMLTAEDIDWAASTISYARKKTGSHAIIHFGDTVAEIVRARPNEGFLFPMISRWNESDRASIFSRRCRFVGVSGVTLHSYRYAWAERGKICGYPERFAQLALGHNSKAVHRAYAKNAQVTLPPLEEYERAHERNVMPLVKASRRESTVATRRVRRFSATVAFRTDADAVVRVDQRNVLDGVVVALQMKRPGVRADVRGVLLGIPHGQAAHGGGMPQLEKRRPILLTAPAGGQNDRPFERFAPDGRIHHALKRDSRWNAQAAFDQITSGRELNAASGPGCVIEAFLNRRRVVAGAVAFGTSGQNGEAAWLIEG